MIPLFSLALLTPAIQFADPPAHATRPAPSVRRVLITGAGLPSHEYRAFADRLAGHLVRAAEPHFKAVPLIAPPAPLNSGLSACTSPTAPPVWSGWRADLVVCFDATATKDELNVEGAVVRVPALAGIAPPADLVAVHDVPHDTPERFAAATVPLLVQRLGEGRVVREDWPVGRPVVRVEGTGFAAIEGQPLRPLPIETPARDAKATLVAVVGACQSAFVGLLDLREPKTVALDCEAQPTSTITVHSDAPATTVTVVSASGTERHTLADVDSRVGVDVPPARTVSVRCDAPGMVPWREQVTDLRPGAHAEVHCELVPARSSVVVSTNAEGTRLTVNGAPHPHRVVSGTQVHNGPSSTMRAFGPQQRVWLSLPSGMARIRATAPGKRPVDHTVRATQGGIARLDVVFEPELAVVPRTARHPSQAVQPLAVQPGGGDLGWPVAAITGGLVLAGVGGAMLGFGHVDSQDARAALIAGRSNEARERREQRDALQRQRWGASVLGAGLLISSSGVLWMLLAPDPEPTLVPHVSPDQTFGLTLQGAW